MRVAVLSGKGGAGKTFVSVNLAVSVPGSMYIDCDVEEPNGRIFLKPEQVREEGVCTKIPSFDPIACIGCRQCVEFCRFNALVFLRRMPKLFPEVCHSCGGCSLVCPSGAVTETDRPVGTVERGFHRDVETVTGILNYGEASGIPVIHKALSAAEGREGLTVIDCPPGSACPVMESVEGADVCILVAEPTAFGFHNFKMVHELVSLLGKPCGVVINKQDEPYEPLEAFCREQNVPILARIPYKPELAALCSEGHIAAEEDPDMAELFSGLAEKLGGLVQ